MKKIIYGILILLGGLAIASNFIVDSNKLDHKQVSASGTACKWIPNTGSYGFGPVYYDESINTIGIGFLVFKNRLRIMDCNSFNEGDVKVSNIVYDKSTSLPLTKKISGVNGKVNGNNIYFYANTYVRFENGKITSEYTCTTIYNNGCEKYSTLTYDDGRFNVKYIPSYSIGTTIYNNDDLEGLLNQTDSYTCVCAEY